MPTFEELHAAEAAHGRAQLQTLLLEFSSSLARLPNLERELRSWLAQSGQEIDYAALSARVEPVLVMAADWLLEYDHLPIEIRQAKAMQDFMQTARDSVTCRTVAALVQKFKAMLGETQRASEQKASEPKATSEKPTTAPSADDLEFSQAEDMYFGDKGLAQDLLQAAVIYHRLAEKKHPKAMARLSNMYSIGQGVKADISKSFQLLRQAAEAGDAESMAFVANQYRVGHKDSGISQSFDQALYWANRAQAAGSRQAGWAFGNVYADEKFANYNTTIAMGHFQKGTEAGCRHAAHELGRIYQEGRGVAKDIYKAISCFETSVRLGGREGSLGYLALVQIYEFGDGVPASPQKALEWYHRAGPRDKGVIATVIGQRYLSDGSKDKAIQWYSEGAGQKDATCMFQLGWFLTQPGPTQNANKAEAWLLAAAETNDAFTAYAASCLIYQIYHPEGLKPNEQKFNQWIEKGGALSDDDLLYMMAGSLFNQYSNQTRQNIPRAIQYYLKGVAKGKGGHCANALGDLYRHCEGYIDYAKSASYYKQAISQGFDSHFSLGWLYRDLIHDFDQAIAAYQAGTVYGNSQCFEHLIEIYLKPSYQRFNPVEARRWLARWQEYADSSQEDHAHNTLHLRGLIPILLHWDEIRDVAKARMYCDRLLAMDVPDYLIDYKSSSSTYLGTFLIKSENHLLKMQGLSYLEKATQQTATKFYNRRAAFDLLIQSYAKGEYGVTPDATKAAYWTAARDKAEASRD